VNHEHLPARRRHRRVARGFTLLEMMVVVASLALLAAIALPDLTPAIHNARLRASVDEVNNFIERARRNARAENRCHRINVTTDKTAVVMERLQSGDCAGVIADASWTEVARMNAPAPGFLYHLEKIPNPGTGPFEIVFRPNGRLKGNGDLDVENDGARIFIEYSKMGTIGMDVLVSSFGRICATRVPARPASLVSSLPASCDIGFAAGNDTLASEGSGFGFGGGSAARIGVSGDSGSGGDEGGEGGEGGSESSGGSSGGSTSTPLAPSRDGGFGFGGGGCG
jgi:prepilin-type N-terminal cleavage/methylation domain-containing protein